jgi:hypothetical protein
MFELFPEEEPWKHASAAAQAIHLAAKLGDSDFADRLEEIFNPTATQVNRIFVSYCESDQVWVDRLERMAKPLLRQAEVEIDRWSETRTQAADAEEIQSAVEAAGVAVALVSPDLLASDAVWDLAMPALVAAAKSGDLRVMWAYLRPAMWEETPLTHFDPINDPTRPLDTLSLTEQDEVLKAVAVEIKKATLEATGRYVSHARAHKS